MTKFSDILLCNLATLGPFGHLRPAPGTFGSLVALGTGYLIASFSLGVLAAAILGISILGVFAAERYGQWIPLVIIPIDVAWYVTAFLLFRFFDITKIGPVGYAEKFTGGVGVMADDLVAGVLVALILWLGAFAMEYAL